MDIEENKIEYKFNKGDIVLYHAYGEYKLVEIKERTFQIERSRQRQDGLYGKPSGPEIKIPKYIIYYSQNNSSVVVGENTLNKIDNLYAFDVKRKGEKR